MLQEPRVSRYGPRNAWRLLYEEGNLETIRDPISRTGADVYYGDLYRFKCQGRDCSIGMRVVSEFTDSNSGGRPPDYYTGLFIKIHIK